MPASIIVLGNEKGGSGKSTVAMHLAVAYLRADRRVACVDLDGRQGSLSRYVGNRKRFARFHGTSLPQPAAESLRPSTYTNLRAAQAEDEGRLEETLLRLIRSHDVIVVDCPGGDTHLARTAHAWADVLLTPLNDSFIDLDGLARIDMDTLQVIGPGHYAEMVAEQRMRRHVRDGGRVRWLVMRNRLSPLDSRNRRTIGDVLDTLAPQLDFTPLPGLTERVAYREMFLRGLTILDLSALSGKASTKSERAALAEVEDVVAAIALPEPAPALAAPPLSRSDAAPDRGDATMSGLPSYRR